MKTDTKIEETTRRLAAAGFDIVQAAPLIPLLAVALRDRPAEEQIATVPVSVEPFIRAHEAARLLDMPLGTLRNSVGKGKIPHHRIGPRSVRFLRSELVAWARGHGKNTRSAPEVEADIDEDGDVTPSVDEEIL